MNKITKYTFLRFDNINEIYFFNEICSKPKRYLSKALSYNM